MRASDQAALTALLLRRTRLKAGLSLAEVAAKLGARSLNAYARYEQGRTTPSVQKLSDLLPAVVPDRDFVLVESRTFRKIRLTARADWKRTHVREESHWQREGTCCVDKRSVTRYTPSR